LRDELIPLNAGVQPREVTNGATARQPVADSERNNWPICTSPPTEWSR